MHQDAWLRKDGEISDISAWLLCERDFLEQLDEWGAQFVCKQTAACRLLTKEGNILCGAEGPKFPPTLMGAKVFNTLQDQDDNISYKMSSSAPRDILQHVGEEEL